MLMSVFFDFRSCYMSGSCIHASYNWSSEASSFTSSVAVLLISAIGSSDARAPFASSMRSVKLLSIFSLLESSRETASQCLGLKSGLRSFSIKGKFF